MSALAAILLIAVEEFELEWELLRFGVENIVVLTAKSDSLTLFKDGGMWLFWDPSKLAHSLDVTSSRTAIVGSLWGLFESCYVFLNIHNL